MKTSVTLSLSKADVRSRVSLVPVLHLFNNCLLKWNNDLRHLFGVSHLRKLLFTAAKIMVMTCSLRVGVAELMWFQYLCTCLGSYYITKNAVNECIYRSRWVCDAVIHTWKCNLIKLLLAHALIDKLTSFTHPIIIMIITLLVSFEGVWLWLWECGIGFLVFYCELVLDEEWILCNLAINGATCSSPFSSEIWPGAGHRDEPPRQDRDVHLVLKYTQKWQLTI